MEQKSIMYITTELCSGALRKNKGVLRKSGVALLVPVLSSSDKVL